MSSKNNWARRNKLKQTVTEIRGKARWEIVRFLNPSFRNSSAGEEKI